ncbi:MAG TPA: hypothetical protein VGI20_04645 [Rhizomicrobium sp.]|jgi:hypothetical protein
MTSKSILLGGALSLALTGAAYAQADTSQAQDTQTTQTKSVHKSVHHVRHHMKHHATAYLHRSSPGEREATRDLNQQQASMARPAGAAYMQNASPPSAPPPGQPYKGMSYNAGATPGGGSQPDNAHVVPH